MTYVDGFVVAVRKDRLDDYKKMAELGGKIWLEYGALTYVECQGTDVPPGEVTSFPMAVQAGPDEVVFFSWVTYADRQERDRISKLVMEDPRMNAFEKDPPLNMQTMIYGGFQPIVEVAR